MHHNTEQEISAANRRFYDAISDVYDTIDPRRNQASAPLWLDQVLQSIAQTLRVKLQSAPVFLDAGAGTGFLVRRAQHFFSKCYAVDISAAMLAKITDPKIIKICSDMRPIPLPDGSVDCVACFATLHHLYQPENLFREAYRLLNHDGIFYSDHDIEAHFVQRFSLVLKIYRYFFDHGKRYLAACPNTLSEDYQLSEYHGQVGISGEALRIALQKIGFREVLLEYHWQGMGPFALLYKLFSVSLLSRAGRSPILRIIAIK